MLSAITAFLESDGSDVAGHTVADVLAFDDDHLERRHDFIQWLFPLPEPSVAVPGSPVLEPEDVEALRGDERAHASLRRGAARMAEF